MARKNAKFERCVRKVKKSKGAKNPYAICHASLNKKKRDAGLEEYLSESRYS